MAPALGPGIRVGLAACSRAPVGINWLCRASPSMASAGVVRQASCCADMCAGCEFLHGCLQDAVTSAGPLLALIGFVVLPFVWSLPEALVTAELATAFPEDSG